jgi:hypothetical protein
MKKTIYLFALAGLTLAACGDNNKKTTTDGNMPIVDGSGSGSGSNNFPAAPTLGAQVDRMGRPAINTALNHAFDPDAAAKGSAKEAYNTDGNVAMWQQTWTPQFAGNLAVIDAVDTGVCGNAICEDRVPGLETAITCPADCGGANPNHGRDGCGNLPKYMPDGNGSATATSNIIIAGLLADDELYLDTSKTACTAYLALEFSAVTGLPVPSCGGRAPTYDVMDYSYSVLTRGLSGFDPNTLAPLFSDNANTPVAGMTDDTFPFLAPPH